jgi:predicted O-methyltransferase YrrM
MALPKAVRRLTPDRLRHSARLRALAVGSGLIPPRTMHSAAEAELLAELARSRRRAVEIGVYEGSSAVVLCRALPADADLHLVDPFVETALHPGWRGSEAATRRVVERAVRERSGPRVHWHVARSDEVAAGWTEPVDLVFIDGDHAEEACRLDWELWSPAVAPGGVVLFHDARLGRPGGGGLPGPTAVLDSLVRDRPGWRIVREVETAVAVERGR